VEEPRRDDVDVKAVYNFLIALAIGCLITFVVVYEIYGYLQRSTQKRDKAPLPIVAEAGRREPPGPRLRVSPPRELQEVKAAEIPRLTTYGWVDKTAGAERVRIPIDRAIELTAERGIPARPATEGRAP